MQVDFFIVDAPMMRASFYIERIDLASKLRKCLRKWRWSRLFSGKKTAHKFSETDPLNHIISRFYSSSSILYLWLVLRKLVCKNAQIFLLSINGGTSILKKLVEDLHVHVLLKRSLHCTVETRYF